MKNKARFLFLFVAAALILSACSVKVITQPVYKWLDFSKVFVYSTAESAADQKAVLHVDGFGEYTTSDTSAAAGCFLLVPAEAGESTGEAVRVVESHCTDKPAAKIGE